MEFQSEKVYAIVSITDALVIDLAESSSVPGTCLITYHQSEPYGDNQKFKAMQNGNGFTLTPICDLNEDGGNVLDYNITQGTLELHPFHGGTNQQFIATEINDGGSGIVKIYSVHDFKCVQNNGESQPITLVEDVSNNNTNQQWKLVWV